LPDARAITLRWLHECVLGLDLCPFAAPVLSSGAVRIAVCPAVDEAEQLRGFLAELDKLQASSEDDIATTLLVYPNGLEDFDDYLAVLDAAQDLLEESGLSALVQLASFHPRYQFDGVCAAALSNYTNRSPLPVIHLLRESSVTRVLASFPDPEAIPGRNIARLEALGVAAVEALWQSLTQQD
jgi:hypothetical protein